MIKGHLIIQDIPSFATKVSLFRKTLFPDYVHVFGDAPLLWPESNAETTAKYVLGAELPAGKKTSLKKVLTHCAERIYPLSFQQR